MSACLISLLKDRHLNTCGAYRLPKDHRRSCSVIFSFNLLGQLGEFPGDLPRRRAHGEQPPSVLAARLQDLGEVRVQRNPLVGVALVVLGWNPDSLQGEVYPGPSAFALPGHVEHLVPSDARGPGRVKERLPAVVGRCSKESLEFLGNDLADDRLLRHLRHDDLRGDRYEFLVSGPSQSGAQVGEVPLDGRWLVSLLAKLRGVAADGAFGDDAEGPGAG